LLNPDHYALFCRCRILEPPDAIAVTLISHTHHHLFQPLLYQVATGILSAGQIAPAPRRIRFVKIDDAEVPHVDKRTKPMARRRR
jgi:NADH dehydrogenase FAD-containing subunit